MNKVFIKKYLYIVLLSVIVLFGVFVRLQVFLNNPSFWNDECGLAWNIKFKSFFELFGVLNFMQVAPPLFLIATKLNTKIFGFSDFTLRIIPFLSGCLSIIAFYFLSRKVFKSNLSVITAVFIFTINFQLINYSFEFKPYGLDALFATICLLIFINLDVEKISTKSTALYGILFAVMPWFSLASVFVIAGGFLDLILKNIKSIKENLLKKSLLILPVTLSCIIYLVTYVISNYTKAGMMGYWQGYFSGNILKILVENIRYFFFPIQYILFLLILLFIGLWLLYKDKSSFLNIFAFSFILLMTASCLHLYPFYERLSLFLVPMFLITITKPLDLISSEKKLQSLILMFLFIITFHAQFTTAIDIVKNKGLNRGEYAREMMDFMVKELKPDDIIVVNDLSDTEFAYYSSFHNIKNKVIQEKFISTPEEKYLNALNSLKSGYYWFYFPDNDLNNPYFERFMSWVKPKNIIYNIPKKASVLLYVELNYRDHAKPEKY
ncbi:MAG: glycosyltransferase family 39 protein [Candidatus Gastranaerophilales bacterium]|nr:glycosyltransferase family 39 protein [Candidatus Gastranaerophilales bacterium]